MIKLKEGMSVVIQVGLVKIAVDFLAFIISD